MGLSKFETGTLVLVLSLMGWGLHPGAALNEEGRALFTFRGRVEFNSYVALKDWSNEASRHPCTWFGVRCEGGRVMALVLSNSFTGGMPPELQELIMLSELQTNEDLLSSNRGSSRRSAFIPDKELWRATMPLSSAFPNVQNATIRRLLQLGNVSKGKQNKNGHNIAKVLASPAPAPAPATFLSHVPSNHRLAPSVSRLSPSPMAFGPSIFLPPSSFGLSPTPGVSPSPMTEPPSPVAERHPQFDAARPITSVPTPSPSGIPLVTAAHAQAKHRAHWTIFVAIAVGVSFLAVSVVFVLCFRANKVVTVKPWVTGLSGQLQKAFVTGVPALKRSELQVACEDFSNVIGSLSDSVLYKGTLSSGVEIAVISSVVASAKDWSKQSESQFRKKIMTLSKVNHKNFVNLLGYCEEEEPFTRMLVFEYAPNGTLFEHLHVKEAEHLDWGARLRIAMGVAYCLEHMLQQRPPFIPQNLDSSTIYLTDDFAAKISDLEFWNETKGSEQVSASSGPLVPLGDPESIVYRFGTILLEIITGRLLFSEEDGLLEYWASSYLDGKRPRGDMIDPSLESFRDETVSALCEVIQSCINVEQKDRPTMAEVVARLRDITTMPPDGVAPKVSPLWWAELEIISSEAN